MNCKVCRRQPVEEGRRYYCSEGCAAVAAKAEKKLRALQQDAALRSARFRGVSVTRPRPP